MSWFQVLKENDAPEPVGKEQEKKPVDYTTSRNFATGRLTKIWQASFDDESWNKFLEENLEDGKLKPDVKRSVLAARKLLAGEVVNLSGTKYNLNNPFGAKKDAMLERLNTVTLRGTKTSNIRESMLSDVDKIIQDGEYQKLLEMLQVEKTRSRIRKYIDGKKELSGKILMDSETEHPELVEIRKLLRLATVSRRKIGSSIDEATVIKYIKLVTAARAGATLKVEAISSRHRNSQNAKALFGRKLLPALDYILENESLDTSRIPTSYQKRSALENNALTRLLSGKGLQRSPRLKTIYNKEGGKAYKNDIENYYGPDKKEQRIAGYGSAGNPNVPEGERDEKSTVGQNWDNSRRRAGVALRGFFNEVKNTQGANEELMNLLGGDTKSSMTPEIRDKIIAALSEEDEDEIPAMFNDAIDDMGINDRFSSIREIESKVGELPDDDDPGDLVTALRRMREEGGKLTPRDTDMRTLKFFLEEEVDTWSILDSVLDDDVSTFDTQGKKGGTLNNIIIALRTLGRMFSNKDLDPEDIQDGEMTAEDFKQKLTDDYSTIREDFIRAVEANMKELSDKGRALNFSMPIQAGSKYGDKKVEPVLWIQYATGVLE
jgi:hypothetical protein|tara:strand:- start:4648 stop:6459 length:1812 start_codon:yes stop_codon:yes gene_type:complete